MPPQVAGRRKSLSILLACSGNAPRAAEGGLFSESTYSFQDSRNDQARGRRVGYTIVQRRSAYSQNFTERLFCVLLLARVVRC